VGLKYVIAPKCRRSKFVTKTRYAAPCLCACWACDIE